MLQSITNPGMSDSISKNVSACQEMVNFKDSRRSKGSQRVKLQNVSIDYSYKKAETKGNRLSSATKRILSKIPLQSSHENIYTVPNILTFSRLVAAPVVGYLLVHNYHAAALSLFAYAGITDLVDGWIARKYHLQTVVGTIIDPMADKLLMTIGVACLAVNGSLPGKCPIDI